MDSACRLYDEALVICEGRMQTEPGAIVDLTRTQGWMALCLASMPEARREALEYAQRAAANLEKASGIPPGSGCRTPPPRRGSTPSNQPGRIAVRDADTAPPVLLFARDAA
jgi:hypothetical protein